MRVALLLARDGAKTRDLASIDAVAALVDALVGDRAERNRALTDAVAHMCGLSFARVSARRAELVRLSSIDAVATSLAQRNGDGALCGGRVPFHAIAPQLGAMLDGAGSRERALLVDLLCAAIANAVPQVWRRTLLATCACADSAFCGILHRASTLRRAPRWRCASAQSALGKRSVWTWQQDAVVARHSNGSCARDVLQQTSRQTNHSLPVLCRFVFWRLMRQLRQRAVAQGDEFVALLQLHAELVRRADKRSVVADCARVLLSAC